MQGRVLAPHEEAKAEELKEILEIWHRSGAITKLAAFTAYTVGESSYAQALETAKVIDEEYG
jgi:hypothetical protein